jgi:DNA polymerase-3 subunit gamma/tau
MTAPSLFAASESQQDREATASPSPNSIIVAATSTAATSLYRKHRPQSFAAEEFVGQDHVVRTLRNAVALGRVAHAYLFSGPRGTGKTTTARLLAKAVNCLHPDPAQRPCNACQNCVAINQNATPDIIEIDAASNRGIDDIRDLRDRVRYAPAQLPSKVYIIDEAHQITGAAANAFLKTLEEPPAHTRFILATTDPEELLPTIVSRCQRFEFRRVGAADIARLLRTVAGIEGIAIDDAALDAIARHATGSLRDALGLLERLSLAADPLAEPSSILGVADVTTALGLSRNDRVEHLVEAIAVRNAGMALRIVQEAIDEGEDARQLNRQLLSYLRLLLAERAGSSADANDRARELAAMFSLTQIAALARRFGEIDFSIKHAPYPQLPLEVALVEAAAASEPANRQEEASLPAPSQPESASARRPTSLRDRVRAGASVHDAPEAVAPKLQRSEPAPITPLRQEPAAPVPASPVSSQGSTEVERIADLWPNVRADVKALNRRIEALLSEVDPVAVTGNQITLAVPYPFHRDKLNSDEVRETVAGVLSRLLGREVAIDCILRGEITSVAPATSAATAAAPQQAESPLLNPMEEERARARLTAAKNIFDAEEITEAGLAPPR